MFCYEWHQDPTLGKELKVIAHSKGSGNARKRKVVRKSTDIALTITLTLFSKINKHFCYKF
jgi:hypothetical protein